MCCRRAFAALGITPPRVLSKSRRHIYPQGKSVAQPLGVQVVPHVAALRTRAMHKDGLLWRCFGVGARAQAAYQLSAQANKWAGVPLCVNVLTLHTSSCEMSAEQVCDVSALMRWDCKLPFIVYICHATL